MCPGRSGFLTGTCMKDRILFNKRKGRCLPGGWSSVSQCSQAKIGMVYINATADGILVANNQ
jgi:hypothetical protein